MKTKNSGSLKAKLLFLILFTSVLNSFCQSKKEQIEILNKRIDSLNQILISERNESLQKIKEFTEKTATLEEQILALNSTLNKTKSELTQMHLNLKTANEQLLNKSMEIKVLENQINEKVDSLEKLRMIPKIQVQDKSAFFAGKYSLDEAGNQGGLNLYMDNDGVYYFLISYVDASYHLGEMFGSFKIYSKIGVFHANLDEVNNDGECKIVFIFDQNGVHIIQKSTDIQCGFGHSVNASGYYYKDSNENQRFDKWISNFEDLKAEDAIPSIENW